MTASAAYRRRRVLTGLLLAALLVTGGCAGDPSPDAEGRVVVVTAPSTDQPQPRLTSTDEKILRAAAETPTGTAEIVVAGDPGAGGVVDLVPRRELGNGRTEVEHGPTRDGLIDANVARVRDKLAGLAPAGGAPDPLRAITDAAHGGHPGTMIVADSGVDTVAPLDLRVLGWEQDPRAVIDDLARRGFVPDLRGWTVRWTSIGRTAGPQAELPEPQRRWLTDLWMELCRRGGAVACVVDADSEQGVPPSSTRPAGPVHVPSVTTMEDGPAWVTTIPSSRLGFTEGSADTSVNASTVVQEIVTPALDGRHTVVVEGYVAFWGTDGYRQDLSERRARAVAGLVVAAGVPADRVTAVGRGAADGPAASQTDGQFDESKVSRTGLRRVVVTVRPATAL